MKKIILIFSALCLLLTCCKNQSGILDINQTLDNNNEVVLRYSDKTKTIWAINIPFKFELSNNSSSTEKFTTCAYVYNNQLGRHSKLYLSDDGVLVRNNPNNTKTIENGEQQTYVIYSQHIIDTLASDIIVFKPYLDRIKNKDQDTLLVGTLEQFKKKHPKFIKYLIEGDSLDFEFLTPDNNFKKPLKYP